MLVRRGEFPKRQEAPPLLCVESAQLPHEGVLAARELSLVHTSGRRDETRVTSRDACLSKLSTSCRRDLVHVMLANFSQEEIVLPKATVIRFAEEISPSVVAAINDEGPSDLTADPHKRNGGRDVYTVAREVKFKRYLGSTLVHLSKREGRDGASPDKIHECTSRRRI